MLDIDEIQRIITNTVSNNIHDFFDGKEVKVTHVLDHIFPRERKIRSLIGGLETSMGTRVWEPLARDFARKNGFTVHNVKSFNSEVPVIPRDVLNFMAQWEEDKLQEPTLPLQQYWTELCSFIDENIDLTALRYQKIPKGQGVDVILEKDGCLYVFDVKTTQLNAGGGPKFTHNIMCWYAYLALMDVPFNVECFLAFPFDPHHGRFWSKEGGKVSPLIPREEAFVADEFWDILTGVKGTTSIIENTFRELGSEFGDQFLHHFD